MGMGDSDNPGGSGGGGGPGGSPGRGGGGFVGGGSGGGGFGRDTPGSPNAPDGKRGSTMGRDGGLATGNGNDALGYNTPGSRQNDRRQGQHANGSTAASRARDAMARHQRESREREGLIASELGIGKAFSLEKELKTAEDEGTMTPRQRDMAIGMEAGMETEGFIGSLGSMIGGLISGASETPGIGDLGRRAAGEAVRAATVPNNPASEYGAAVASERMSNSMMQNAAEAAAGFFGGPPAAMATSMANTAINMNENQAIADLNADIDARHNTPSNAPGNQTPSPSGNGKASTAIAAMSRSPGMTASRPPGRAFGWSPVDIGRYRRNPMNLARNS